MKKILLVAVMTLFFVSCSGRGRSSNTNTTTDPNLNTNTITCVDNATFSVLHGKCECNSGYIFDTAGTNCVVVTTTTCGEHASLVNGACVCDSGYTMDQQNNCVTIGTGKIKLSAPVITVSGTTYQYDPVTDINGVLVPTGTIHHVAVKLSALLDSSCETATYLKALNCTDGTTLYKLPVTIPAGTVGTFCVKAIACDDTHETSDIMYKKIIVQ